MKKRLRVLTSAFACAPVGSSDHLGGGEAVLGWNLVRQLARFHEVWVLTHGQNRGAIEQGLPPGDSSPLHFCYLRLPGFLERLKSVQGGIQFYAYLWQVRAYFAARKLHRQAGFDAFHHITYANDWMASYVGALLPVPYFRGPGGGAHRTPPGFLREYPAGARFWERVRSFGQWAFRHDPFFIMGQRRAAALLVCNREAADAVPGSLRHKVQLFPVNAISAEDLNVIAGEAGPGLHHRKLGAENPAAPAKPFHVLYAGKLLGLKGVALGIRGFSVLARRHADVKFTLIGDGPERPRLEALIEELGMGDRIQLDRWRPRAELLVAMREADVFLFPSLRDGGGAVVVEAMAAGRPVICMDLAGPGLHVTESCGIKIPPETPDQTVEGIATALERLYADRDLVARMGKAARRRVEQDYVLDKLGDRLRGIYERALGIEIPDVSEDREGFAGVVREAWDGKRAGQTSVGRRQSR